MIVTCPACRTRYLVDDEKLHGTAGRVVRCAGCGNTWHFAPEASAPPDEPLPPVADAPRLDSRRDAPPLPRDDPRLDAPPPPASQPLPPPPPPPRTANLATIAWIVAIVLLAGVILAGILGRSKVVAQWPAAARLYALAGLGTTPPGAGLEITKVTPTRTTDGLVIAGEIVNTGAAAVNVPRLRVALLDPGAKEVQFKIIDPPRRRLLPGEVVHFTTPFTKVGVAATKVAVTFAPG